MERRYTYVDRCTNGDDPRKVKRNRWPRAIRGARFKYSVVLRLNGKTERLVDYIADPKERFNLLDSALSTSAEEFVKSGRRLLLSR